MPNTERPLRILSLDGGGVRGLSSLFILDGIMAAISPQEDLRPCEWFDLIAGTSSGGIIAVMLGRLGMTISECIRSYSRLSGEIFKTPQGPGFWTLGKQVIGIEKHRAEHLEKAVREILTDRLSKEEKAAHDRVDDVPLLSPADIRDRHAKVFVVAVQTSDCRPIRITNYPPVGRRPEKFTILQAVRATSAASSIFEPLIMETDGIRESFCDGALGYNNPINEVIAECNDLWPVRDIGCLVSIGTGRKKTTKVGRTLSSVAKACAAIATDGDETAHKFLNDISQHRRDLVDVYFRFTVQSGLEDRTLDETRELGLIKQRTQSYVREEKREDVRRCADVLKTATMTPAVPKVTTMRNTSFFVPTFFRADDFIGRGEVLENLYKGLFIQADRKTHRTVTLLGMKGQGKTQIALEFCDRHRERYKHILWFDASTRSTAERSFLSIAAQFGLQVSRRNSLDINQLLERIWTQLDSDEPEPKWLIVADNADNLDEFGTIKQFLPPAALRGRGHIIITSCNRYACDLIMGQGVSIDVEALAVDEAVELLLRRAHLIHKRDDHEQEAVKIVNRLGCLALAVAQAGSYIALRSLAPPRYLEEYEEEAKRLLEYRPDFWSYNYWGPSEEDQRRGLTVFTTLEQSFKHIRPEAANLLQLLAFLDTNLLSLTLFNSSNTDEPWSTSNDSCTISRDLYRPLSLNGDWDPNRIDFALSNLVFGSLIHRAERQVYWMHPVVADWLQHRLPLHSQLLFSVTAMKLLWKALPDPRTVSLMELAHRPDVKQLASHAFASWRVQCRYSNRYSNFVKQSSGIKGWNALRYQEAVVALMMLHGSHSAARELLEEVVSVRRTTGSPEVDTAWATVFLAMAYRGVNNFLRASECCNSALLVFKRQPGQGNKSIASLRVMNELAAIKIESGSYEGAQELLTELAEISSDQLSPVHPETIRILSNMAAIHGFRGDYCKAEGVLDTLYHRLCECMGKNDPSILRVMNHLAVTYALRGRIEEASKLHRKVWEERSNLLGTDDPLTLRSQLKVGDCLIRQRNLATARRILSEVVEKSTKRLGQFHLDTLRAKERLATTYRLQQQYAQSEKLQMDVVGAKKTLLGDSHPSVIRSLERLALVYTKQKRYNEAKVLQEEVQQKRGKLFDGDHPDVRSAEHNLEVINRLRQPLLNVLDFEAELYGNIDGMLI